MRINKELIRERSSIIRDLKAFFSGSGYLEVETPILAPSLIPESCIEAFRTSLLSPYGPSRDLYMVPSPEIYIKQLIADGIGDVFEVSRCFRNSEQCGRIHNPEFTMAEWYKMDADYLDSILIAEELFSFVIDRQEKRNQSFGTRALLAPPFVRMSMDEAMLEFAGTDISGHCCGRLSEENEAGILKEAAERLGLSAAGCKNWEEIFNLIFVHSVEPSLPSDRPLVLYDYPAGIPTLARKSASPGRLQRWELYAGGAELANCYSEETAAETVRNFFRAEYEAKKNALQPVPEVYDWCDIYENGYPDCSGTAMGVDRLVMLMTGGSSLEGVILFPFSDRIG